MPSSAKVSAKDSITCTICHEIFDDPRLMPCSHTYCHKCIKQMATTTEDHFECPSGDKCKISKKDIDSLPLNRSIQDLVKLHGSMERSNLCTNCHTSEAEHACDRCTNEQFCSKCYHTVHASPVMQKHHQLKLSQRFQELIPCKTHGDEKLKYWCRRCHITICPDCVLLEHKEHPYVLIHDEAKEFETKTHIELQTMKSSIEYRINQTERRINEIHKNGKSSRLIISEVMGTLREIIDQHETALMQQVLTVEHEQRKQFEDYKTLLKTELQSMNTQKATLEVLLSSKNQTTLLQSSKRFIEYMDQTSETFQSLSIPTIVEYHLEGMDELQNLSKQIVQFGRYIQAPPYRNPQLERIIDTNHRKQQLNLSNNNLSDSDMIIVTNALRRSTALTKLDLENNQIGEHGAQYIADALKTNQTLTVLYLENNQIGEEGAEHIADALKINRTLTVLDLNGNKIAEQGAEYISDALKTNHILTGLHLHSNQLGEQGAQHIAHALKLNQTLTGLYLRDNKIGEQGAHHIADGLKTNGTLTKLDLENNQIGEEGAEQIADALKTNQTLIWLYLRNNNIGQQGAQYIADALKVNRTLSELGLSSNHIGEQGAQYIADALGINQTLTSLHFKSNKIGDQGAQYFADALKINQALTKLDLGNNHIGEQGAEEIADALEINRSLSELLLTSNQIKQQGAQCIVGALKMNQTLAKLHLTDNGIEEQEKQRIKEALITSRKLSIDW